MKYEKVIWPQYHMVINLAEMNIKLADLGKSFMKIYNVLFPRTNQLEFCRPTARILNSISSFKY